ncbi:MAG TPA: hypothetical protein VEQ87_14730 [Burkholderiales bacterium]|nr:hypothetical protein [Burkholderiales bacterium]
MGVAPLMLALALAAAPLGPNLFVAGDGFTLEQAMADAQAQRTPEDPPPKILVTGDQAARLAAARATPDTIELIRRARRGGAGIYVCGKDLKAHGLRPGDLVPGVIAVRGYVSGDPSRAEDWERRLPPAPDRKSMAICASD